MTAADPSSAVTLWHAVNSSGAPGVIESVCHAWLDDADRQRADRFRKPTTRNQHVIGRGMSRCLLAGTKLDPRSIEFGVEPHGKPVVHAPREARRPFNVTHTDGLVICGIGHPRLEAIGVDVERLGRRTDASLADRYFSQPEIEFLNRCRSDEARRRTFLRIWTLKESFIKAIGTGLTMPLADFAFEDVDSDQPTIRMLNPKLESETRWQFYSIEPRPGFIAALAVASGDDAIASGFELRAFEEHLALLYR